MRKEHRWEHEFTFTSEEAKVLRAALDYCYHRATTEKKIARYFDVEKLDVMRKFVRTPFQ